jgi:uncharacterized protein YqiB (DUF1249 family)
MKKQNISQYLINEDDKILISYGTETNKEVTKQLEELESIARYNYQSLEKLMTLGIGTVQDGTFDGDLAFKTFEKLMTIDMKNQEEKNSLEYQLSKKQYEYDVLVQQDANKKAIDSVQNEIKQIQSELNLLESKKSQYTTEDIFQRVSKIEEENIRMYKIGPELYKKLVAAKNTFESQILDESIPFISSQINPDTKSLDIILQKNAKDTIEETEKYKAIIDEMIPKDVSWNIILSD